MADMKDYFLGNDQGQPNLLHRFLGGVVSGAAGTISPMQAYQMGHPGAGGMTMDQLKMMLAAPQQQAQVQNIQAQAAQRTAAANKPASSYGSMDELVEGIHQWVSSGGKEGTPLDAIPGFGVNSLKAQAVAALSKKYPMDMHGVSQAEMGFAGGKAGATSGARAPNSPAMFKIRALAKSLLPQLDNLSEASDAVTRNDLKALNRLKGKLGVEFSSKDWSNLKKRAMIVADEFQAQIGAGSDQKLDLAKQLIDSSDSPEVLKNAIGIMREAAKSRAIASTGATPTQEDVSADQPKAGKPMKIGRFHVEVQ